MKLPKFEDFNLSEIRFKNDGTALAIVLIDSLPPYQEQELLSFFR